MPVDRQTYRDAMARLGAAVNIVTTANQTGRHGFTASAVCSVTDDPATLLVCMNRTSRSRAQFALGDPLCVNVLATHQQPVSVAFASREAMAERFESAHWTVLATEVGTHSVLFCAVQAVRLGEPAGGLIYFGRDYHALPQAVEQAPRRDYGA
jgi:flavin reductase